MNHVEASLVLPELPAVLRPDLPQRGTTRSSPGSASRRTTTGWSTSGAAGSGGRLIPLCLVPLWDAELAAAEVRRNAARGVQRGRASPSCRRGSGSPSIHSGYWDPFFAACAETGTVVAMHIGSGTKTITSSDDAPDAVQAINIFANSALSLIDFLFSGVLVRFPEPEAALRRGADRVDPLRARTRRRRLGRPPRVERQPAQRHRAAVAVLLPAGRRAASSRTASASRTSTASAATTSRSRPTTRTRTAPGPTRTRSPRSCSVTSTRRRCTTIVRGNAIRLLGLEGLGDGTGAAFARDDTRPAATTVVDRAPRSARSSSGCWARSACPPTRRRSSPTTWSRPTCAASTPTASHLMALYHGRVRSGHLRPDDHGHDARRPRARPCGSTAGSASARSSGVAAVDLAVERAARARRRDRVGPRAHAPRRARLLHDARRRRRDASPWRSRTAPSIVPPVRRDHRPVLDQPVLVRGARRYAIPTSSTTSPPPRPRATRSCSPASAATRPSPRAGPTTSTATRPPTRRRRRSRSCSGSVATRASASGCWSRSWPGVLADSSFGTTEHSDSELTGWDRIAKGASFVVLDVARFLPVDRFRAHVDRLIDDVHASELAPGHRSDHACPASSKPSAGRSAWRRASRSPTR